MEKRKSKLIIHEILIGFITVLFLLGGIVGIAYSVYAYPNIFKTDVSLEKSRDLNPHDHVSIVFSEPVMPSSVESSLSLFPAREVFFEWSNSNKNLKISPKDYWQPEREYSISIKNARSMMFTRIDSELRFNTARYPSIESFYPANGEKNIIIDIEDPIIASFNKPLEDYSVKFLIDSKSDLRYEQDKSKKHIKLMPMGDMEKGRKYTIKVLIKHKKEPEDRFKKIYETSFETFVPLRPSQWDKDPETKLAQAKEHTSAKVKAGKYIDINLAQQTMVIFENGKALDAYLVSSGKKGMETPVGDFQIRNKSPKPWSKKYALFMPNWMAIVPSGEFGIHELPEWPGGYKEGQNHLGIPVSHGCVRLGVGPAKRVYDWADMGTPVLIYNYN
jgi:lipoprotein-anchoring transpeptidase ErfK/SrfK